MDSYNFVDDREEESRKSVAIDREFDIGTDVDSSMMMREIEETFLSNNRPQQCLPDIPLADKPDFGYD
jgi:hypothetical protein